MTRKNKRDLLTDDIQKRFNQEKKLIPKVNKREFSPVKIATIIIAFLLAFFMIFSVILPLLKF